VESTLSTSPFTKSHCLRISRRYSADVSYTFGDSDEASLRLRRLAEIYEAETRELLGRAHSFAGSQSFSLAIDFGCGPGWTTRLIADVLRPARTIGLESSERYVMEARSHHPDLRFLQHDVLVAPFPAQNADLLFCRFLLTHLASPHEACKLWAQTIAAPGALLVLHETESMQSGHPALARYYEMVGQMQRHFGQELNVGTMLEAALADTPWQILHSECRVLEKPACRMASLHAPNLRTWGKNSFAIQNFDPVELASLEQELTAIAEGRIEAGVVHNAARQIVARRS